MNVGTGADLTGLESGAIRLHEQERVPSESASSPFDFHIFEDQEIDLFRFVRGARSLGVSLDDIRSIVVRRNKDETPCTVVREVISMEAQSIKSRIAELQTQSEELLRLENLAASTKHQTASAAPQQNNK